MTIWATFRDTLVRPLLKDAGALTDPEITAKWTDAELLAYANLALDDLSNSAPLYTYAAATGVDGSTAQFALPDDLLALDSVTLNNVFLEEYEPVPGRALPGTSSPTYFLLDWPQEGLLTLTRAPAAGSALVLHYSAWRGHLVDAASELPVGHQRWLEQALAMYVCYLAHLREGVGAASLEQWKGRQDLNVGNPLNLQAREFLAQYQRLVRENRPREVRTYA